MKMNKYVSRAVLLMMGRDLMLHFFLYRLYILFFLSLISIYVFVVIKRPFKSSVSAVDLCYAFLPAR